MADNIITPEFRSAFVSIFKASAQQMPDGTKGAPKYSIRACFPPSADLSTLKKQAELAVQEKFGANIPKSLRSPFRKNEELDNPVVGVGDDWTIVTFSANEDRRPGIVDAQLQDIIDSAQVYSGAWFRAQVRAYGYDKAGNKGVAFGLQNVQKLRDDDPIGGGAVPASKAFEAVGGGGKTAGSMFD